MSHKEARDPILSYTESLMVSISKMAASAACLEPEKEIFLEIGCCFYRASIAIMELQTAEDIRTVEAVQSLTNTICLAKDLVNDFLNSLQPITDPEVKTIIGTLVSQIRHIGETLSLVPSLALGDQEYAQLVIISLSKELQNVEFKVKEPILNVKDQIQQEPEQAAAESDLYPVIDLASTENSQVLSIPQLVNLPRMASESAQKKKHRNSLSRLPQLAEYMEPIYDTFLCPLTNKIMDDPVTLQSGVTYERKAITEWFEKFEKPEEIYCPASGENLLSRALGTNMALKATIGSWRERNETARIKVDRAALSLGSSEVMILEAIQDLQSICKKKEHNMIQVRDLGIFPLLVKFILHKDKGVRCAVLELLRELVEADEDSKDMIGKMVDMETMIEMLSSRHQQMRHASLLFLLELSKSKPLCEKLGSTNGGILTLVTTKYNQSIDPFASKKAEEVLKNLESIPSNIMCMAENGLLAPLLHHLTEGSEEMKIEMAGYLGETVLGDNYNTNVAEMASPSLIKMVHSGSTLARREALKALVQISSYHQNGKILVGFGVVEVMVGELFTRRIYDEPMNSKEEAAAVLANILESGVEVENLQVNTHGHTLTSNYVVCNLIGMLKNSMPDKLNINLIRILLCLTKFPKSSSTIVSVVKQTDASHILLEFINNPHEQLGVAAIKFLVFLSPYMGHMIAMRLCKIRGQPESLIQNNPIGVMQITERHAVSANLLAKLPHQNLEFNLVLINRNVVPTVLETIRQIQRGGTRRNKYAGAYLESLVGILVRFTTTLYESQVLLSARSHNFTSVLTELLMQASSDEVQRLSAVGLENLSSESVNLSLSEPHKITKSKSKKLFCMYLSFRASKVRKPPPMCPIHRGACSSQNTFCLVEANAVERLLSCLDHENAEVVGAALSALCTLLDEKVDVDKSISMLSEANTLSQVLNVVKTHREGGLWQKSFWVIDKFLMKAGDESATDISRDKFLPASLVSALHHGDKDTSQIAEKILKHLNKMPSFSASKRTM